MVAANPPYSGIDYNEGGNFFGHIRLDEQYDIEVSPVEIGLFMRFDSWGDWIEWPTPTWVVPDPPETPQWVYNQPVFHAADIDLGRKCHPILYGCKDRKKFFDRFFKYHKYLIR